jgi:plasmid maintenance system antidote protein VapI
VKSDFCSNKLNLDELTARLRAYIRLQINSGEFTERSLARVFHISQPHLHNVLKGARRFTLEFADQVMSKFQITVFDLISDEEIWNYFDEKNPDWRIKVAKRKPPVKTVDRESDPRAPWRESNSGS